MSDARERQLPVGAEPIGPGRVHFRVWAPDRRKVEVVFEDDAAAVALVPEGNGYHAGSADAAAGDLYRYRLDGELLRPDPASRFQPAGPHGPSQIVDPAAYRWSDDRWRGPDMVRPVLYELHVGTFTPAGTWAAAAAHLPELAELGVSVLELMPVCAFPGRFGWGYDGVDLFAPTQLYGTPDDMRGFVDAAHAHGLGVLLDVVYNHFGPDGCYLRDYTSDYFSRDHHTEWGDALNFDGRNRGPVREFFLANARHWVREYHLDGLRLDATQSIFDRSEPHIIHEVVRAVRAASPERRTLVIGENEPQHAQLLRGDDQGGALDAVWNDDFHHTARVALTGRRDAYYTDYGGTPQELISAVRHGYLFQGQYYGWQKQRRGTPALDLQPAQFVNFLQNHDQVANSASGWRLHELTSPAMLRAMTALLLLAPGIPLLFQGQEFAASSPFLYFADHERELAERVRNGRRDFLAQFRSIDTPAVLAALPHPDDPATFTRSVLRHEERELAPHAQLLALHRDLIALSSTSPFVGAQRADIEGAVLGSRVFLLRWFGGESADDRLVLTNLGEDLSCQPLPEPLLAPPALSRWRLAWSSEEPKYGGQGAPDDVESEPAWRIPGWATVVLRPRPAEDAA